MKTTYFEEADCLDHFSKGLSSEIQKYATEEAFKNSRYIFTLSYKKQQYGYCTHCRKEFKAGGLKHNQKYECPNCKSKCMVKYAGLGRKYMIDEAYFVYYEKSLINPQVIIARGVYAVRDYRHEYRNLNTKYVEMAMYVFEMGRSYMFSRYAYYSRAETMEHGTWGQCKSVYSLFGQYHMNSSNVGTTYNHNDLKDVVKESPFQYSTWESYRHDDMVKFFDMYSKYPCVEYLTKLGFDDLVNTKLQGGNTYSSINWRGKNLLQVLKLNKQAFNEIRTTKHTIDPLFLKMYQISNKDGSNLSLSEIYGIAHHDYFYSYRNFQKMLQLASLRKVTQYIDKQADIKSKDHQYYGRNQVLTDWIDYLSDCRTLMMDISDESVLFPKNLHNAHQNTIKQIKIKADKEANRRMMARVKSLEKYCFECNGLLLRPAKSADELIEEGKALHHCVGTYAKRHADGECAIFLIRKASEPDKPYYTMQIQQDRIIQTRGKNNDGPKADVEEFIKAFTEEKLTKKKDRVKISVPA